MKKSIKEELTSYINERVEEIKRYGGSELEELHFHLFNQDYYIIGYYQAQKWLDGHGVSVFDALETIREYEDLHFGECRSYKNAEETVNMLAYIYGEELLTELELI
mgnify:CR=1 FL=1|tara:strand:- start:51 stop:368 length:318 start_codon:yes stop_codon:yes gene_type:complete